MRKPRRFSQEELLPYQWQMPRLKKPKRGVSQETENDPDNRSSPQTRTPIASESLNWQALFGNANPVEIEVGMGKGLFLLNTSVARPETNFFGIELARKYQLYATSRFALRKLTNVKTVCADARWVLRQFVPSGSVAAIHVYFPDPWWKARHKKRRVFTSGFAADAAQAIQSGGRLLIASDVEEYFGVMCEIIRAMPAFCEVRSETSCAPLEEAGYQTNFERKARLKGTPIWRAEFERTKEAVKSHIEL